MPREGGFSRPTVRAVGETPERCLATGELVPTRPDTLGSWRERRAKSGSWTRSGQDPKNKTEIVFLEARACAPIPSFVKESFRYKMPGRRERIGLPCARLAYASSTPIGRGAPERGNWREGPKVRKRLRDSLPRRRRSGVRSCGVYTRLVGRREVGLRRSLRGGSEARDLRTREGRG